MADTTPSSPAVASPNSDTERGDWPAQITAQIVQVVDQVKSKTTRPAELAVRAVVYGLVAAFLGITIAIVLFIGLFRAVDVVRNLIIEDSVWLTYLFLGAVFSVVGAVLFTTRKTPK